MKKLKWTPGVLIAVIFPILLTSCYKIPEFALKHPDADIKRCNIQTFSTTSFSYGFHYEAIFAYNKWGDPVSITSANVGSGFPNREFFYDQRHRLTDYTGPYGNGGYEFWERLVYDDSGNIIRDTVFMFGTPSSYDHANSYVNFYEYDSYKRVSKVTKTFPLGSTKGQQGNQDVSPRQYVSDRGFGI